MNNNMAVIKLNNIHKGTWFKMSYVSDVTPSALAKREGAVISKRTEGTFRVGVRHSATKVMRNKIAEGYVPQPRKWGTYVKDSDRLIEHTNKDGQHNIYVELHSSPNRPKTTYYLNGEVVKKEKLLEMGYVTPSTFKSNDSGVITVNLNNIESIG